MMLATWLVEIFLAKINQLEDVAAAERGSDDVENFKAEQGLMEDDMRQFLSTYKVASYFIFVDVVDTLLTQLHRTTWTPRRCSTSSRATGATR